MQLSQLQMFGLETEDLEGQSLRFGYGKAIAPNRLKTFRLPEKFMKINKLQKGNDMKIFLKIMKILVGLAIVAAGIYAFAHLFALFIVAILMMFVAHALSD